MEKYSYKYPHPAIATDIAVFTLQHGELHVALIRRGLDPFKGKLALPGGFLREDEDLDACALRELKEETGAEGARLYQFGNFSEPKRDPRERVVSIAYLALVRSDKLKLVAGSDATQVEWISLSALFQERQLPMTAEMAFDHATILQRALSELSERAINTDIALSLLPEKFTLTQMQAAIEEITKWSPTGSKLLDKRNFRRWVTNLKLVRKVAGKLQTGHRPAQLYTARNNRV